MVRIIRGLTIKTKRTRTGENNPESITMRFKTGWGLKTRPTLLSNKHIRKSIWLDMMIDGTAGRILYHLKDKTATLALGPNYKLANRRGIGRLMQFKALEALVKKRPTITHIDMRQLTEGKLGIELREYGFTRTETEKGIFDIREFKAFLRWIIARDTFVAESDAKREKYFLDKEKRTAIEDWIKTTRARIDQRKRKKMI